MLVLYRNDTALVANEGKQRRGYCRCPVSVPIRLRLQRRLQQSPMLRVTSKGPIISVPTNNNINSKHSQINNWFEQHRCRRMAKARGLHLQSFTAAEAQWTEVPVNGPCLNSNNNSQPMPMVWHYKWQQRGSLTTNHTNRPKPVHTLSPTSQSTLLVQPDPNPVSLSMYSVRHHRPHSPLQAVPTPIRSFSQHQSTSQFPKPNSSSFNQSAATAAAAAVIFSSWFSKGTTKQLCPVYFTDYQTAEWQSDLLAPLHSPQ